jgi:hypothetical protein
MTAGVEPLLVPLMASMVLPRCRDGIQDCISQTRKLRMPGDDVAPALERQHDATPVGIEGFPHRSIVNRVVSTGNSLLETCP